MSLYTVIGIYHDNLQPFAECYEADDLDHAEEQAQDSARDGGGLIIAGVIEGKVSVL